jgi:hypothetical protein
MNRAESANNEGDNAIKQAEPPLITNNEQGRNPPETCYKTGREAEPPLIITEQRIHKQQREQCYKTGKHINN